MRRAEESAGWRTVNCHPRATVFLMQNEHLRLYRTQQREWTSTTRRVKERNTALPHLVGAFEQEGIVLRLQFALNLLPFPLFVLEQDPGEEEKTDVNSPIHETGFNSTAVRLGR